MVLIGDSHADTVREGFETYARARGLRSLSISRAATLPLLKTDVYRGKTNLGNLRKSAESMMDISTETDPDLVVMVGRWALPYYSDRPGLEHEPPAFLTKDGETTLDIIETRAAYANGLRISLETLKAKNIPVLIVGQVPHLGINPAQCMARPSYVISASLDNCTYFTADSWRARISPVDSFLQDIVTEVGHGEFVSTTDFFCGDDKNCTYIKDNKMLYRDDDHLSVNGAKFLVEKLEPSLDRLLKTTPPK